MHRHAAYNIQPTDTILKRNLNSRWDADMQSFDFVNRANSEFIDQLYQRYRKDPRSVDEQWRAFFSGFEAAGGSSQGIVAPGVGSTGTPTTIGVFDLVHSFRELGHFVADLDPLGHNRPNHPLLELSQFNMELADRRHPARSDRQTDGHLLPHDRRRVSGHVR
jgi:2-oxoglutarate dehydrogenase E1 component